MNTCQSNDELIELLSLTKLVAVDGTVIFKNADGQRHRIHGPAIICPGSHVQWYRKGRLHRVDGPAITYASGQMEWYHEGQMHRDDGPAVIRPDGTCRWYLHDCKYSESEWRYWVNSDTYRISVYGQ